MEVEPVEPQSLKKLSFKSLKRALDLFSPVHQQLAPPDLQSKQIRINYKVNAEYGGIKNTTQPPQQTKDSSQQAGSSNALALAGPGNPDLQKGGPQKALVVGPTMPSTSTNGLGSQGKSTVVIPSSGSSERNFSTSALMERMPSKWPRPVWHAPWKNYRVRTT